MSPFPQICITSEYAQQTSNRRHAAPSHHRRADMVAQPTASPAHHERRCSSGTAVDDPRGPRPQCRNAYKVTQTPQSLHGYNTSNRRHAAPATVSTRRRGGVSTFGLQHTSAGAASDGSLSSSDTLPGRRASGGERPPHSLRIMLPPCSRVWRAALSCRVLLPIHMGPTVH